MWSRHARIGWIVLLLLAVALLAGWMVATPVAAQDAPDPASPEISPAVQPETTQSFFPSDEA